MKKEPVKSNNQQKDKDQDSRKGIFLPLLIVFILPVLLYVQTLGFGYTNFDDDKIIEKHIAFLNNFQNVPHAFLTDAFIDGNTKFYRPMQTISYMVDLKVTGVKSTWMFHFTNLLLFGLIACLLFILLRRFLFPMKVALISTLIYSVHPLFLSNVAWIPARGDLLLILFCLLSFILFIDYLQKRKTICLAGHLITYTLALFCKETAVVLPLLFILYFLTFQKDTRLEKRNLLIVLSYLLIGIFWFWIRTKAIDGHVNTTGMLDVIGRNNHFGLLPVLRNMRTIPEMLASFIVPLDIALIPNFSLFKTVTGLLILILTGVLFFKNKTKSKGELLFCLGWFLLFLLPTMLYKHERIDYLQHRFFLPLVGILLFLLFSVPANWIKKGNKIITIILVVILIGLSTSTFIKSRAFSDPMKFYSSAIKQNPASYFAYNNRGFILSKQRSYSKAIEDFTNAIQLKPDYAQAYYNRGNALSFKGLNDNAISDYSKAIAMEPNYTDAYTNRAAVYLSLGQVDKALVDCTKSIELKPDNAMAYYNRGTIFLDHGSYDKAIDDCSKAIEIKPDYAMAYYIRGESYKSKGLDDQAIFDYSKALSIKHDIADAYNSRGLVYMKRGLNRQACQDFRTAGELGLKAATENYSMFCK